MQCRLKITSTNCIWKLKNNSLFFGIILLLIATPLTIAQEPLLPPDLTFSGEAADVNETPSVPTSKAERTKLIETDRNSYTFSRQTLAAGQTITETSYSYIKVGKEGAKHSYPELIMRHGLTDDIEFRFGYNFESEKGADNPESEVVNKFGINAQQQAFYGVKFQLTEQLPENKRMPDTAFMINGRSPIGSIEKHGQIGLGYAFGWELPNRMNFDGALLFGTERFKADNYFSWSPSTVLKIPLGQREKWFTQIEYFGLFSSSYKNNFALNFIDTGLHYFITDNWEIGTILGTGINESARGIFLNFGTGIRY